MPFIEDEEDGYHETLRQRRAAGEGTKALEEEKEKDQEGSCIEPQIEEEEEVDKRIQSWPSSSSSDCSSTLVASSPPPFKSSVKHKEEIEEFAAFYEENDELYAAIEIDGLCGKKGKSEVPRPAQKPRKRRRLGMGRPPALKIEKSKEEIEAEDRAKEKAEKMDNIKNGPYREYYLPFLDQKYIPPSFDQDEGEY